MVCEGMRTPWGKADSVSPIMEGLDFVGTPSHGGVFVSRKRNAIIPAYMRRANGWYEEDCDWAIPFCVFEMELQAHGSESAKKAIAEGHHRSTLRNWSPDAYERYFGVTVTPEESYVRGKEAFAAKHANDWIVYSATGDWDKGVPKGMVKCHAGKGLRGNQLPNPTRVFFVPKEEYETRSTHGFVIDLNRHEELVEVAQ